MASFYELLLAKKLAGGGSAPIDPNVLFDGVLTFAVNPEYDFSENTEPFTMTRLPEDSETAYLYVDGSLIGNSNWEHYEASGDDPEGYSFSIYDGGADQVAYVYYENNSGWGGYVDIMDGSLTGAHSVEIRKTAKS